MKESVNTVASGDRIVDVAGQEQYSAEDSKWLQRGASLFQDSTTYYESSVYNEWRSNLAHFHSQHAPGSKYLDASFTKKSKLFRPKPRSSERILEATAAAALFTNDDLIAVSGVDPNNKIQADAAKVHKAILQHRLENSIKWFLTVIGAFQDTNVYGVVVSRQYWDYQHRTNTSYTPAFDDDGEPMMEDGVQLGYENKEKVVYRDRPAVDIINPENFRWDPACDWRDPIGDSPYLFEEMPMYVIDVHAMESEEAGGWKSFTTEQLVTHGRQNDDQKETLRAARERGQEDSTQVATDNEFTLIWVRRCIIRDQEGQDWVFHTVGDSLLLSDVRKLEEEDPLGREGYVCGITVIETHNTHPSGPIELNRPLTDMSNDITNQRFENVKLALNRRYKVRSDANVDIAALMRNVAGGAVVMDDIENDVGVFETPDITQSSYVEQDRFAVESDEIFGTFSQASVQSNRSLNETVGGMNLMDNAANQVQELGLRTFIETWVEPVLRGLVKLEALYETDETILALAAGKAEIEQQLDDGMMLENLVVKVNVGMGNTNPTQKMDRFMKPLEVIGSIEDLRAKIDWDEVGKEVWALAGQGDGERFMLTEEKIAENQEKEPQEPPDPRIIVAQINAELKQIEYELMQGRMEQEGIIAQMEIQSKQEIAMTKIAAERDIKLEVLYAEMGIKQQDMGLKLQLEQSKDRTQRDIAALKDRHELIKTKLQAANMAAGFDTF